MPSEVAQTTNKAAGFEAAVPEKKVWWKKLLVPSLSDVLFGAVVVWIFATGAGWKALLGDGDTGYHIRTGDYVLATGQVPSTDLFSFSKATDPWFAWEWLSAVVYSLLHTNWEMKGVVFFAGVVISISVAALFRYTIYRGTEVIPAMFLCLLASGAASVHYLARPHVVTFLFLVTGMYLLESDRRERSWKLWLLAPLACLWANMHGGFAALFAIIGLLGLGALFEGLVETSFDWRRAIRPGDGPAADKFRYFQRLAAVGGLSLIATLANPFGYHLHWHILKYLRNGWLKKHVQEFQSPNFRSEEELQFQILLFLGLVLAALLLQQRRFGEAFLLLFWAHQSLASVRHITIYAWVATPIIGAELTRLWRTYAATSSSRSLVGVLRDLSRDVSAIPLHTSVWGLVLLVFLWTSPTQAWPTEFPDIKFPVRVVERYGSKLNPPTGPKPKILASDQFGDYLIYRFYPDVRVFMDGRGDFYGPEFGDEYIRIMSVDWRWRQLMDKWDFDYAMLPREWSLSETLKLDPRWKILEDSGPALLFERRRP